MRNLILVFVFFLSATLIVRSQDEPVEMPLPEPDPCAAYEPGSLQYQRCLDIIWCGGQGSASLEEGTCTQYETITY